MDKSQKFEVEIINQVELLDLGVKRYHDAWKMQQKLFNQVTENRDKNYLILTEHPSVITLGKSSDKNNIITNPKILKEKEIEVVEIDRGGDVTYHGPGQIVGYPIFNLELFKKDIHWYLRSLEEVIIQTLSQYEVTAGRIEGLTGVWVGNKKICAMGIKVTRWVTMHGFALNVTTQLENFNHIIPCGIQNKTVTSLQELTGRKVSQTEIKNVICKTLQTVFNVEIKNREYAQAV